MKYAINAKRCFFRSMSIVRSAFFHLFGLVVLTVSARFRKTFKLPETGILTV